MNVSVVVTVLNEEGSISNLLNPLLEQSKKPDEIVVVDGGSTDKTKEIALHFERKYRQVKFFAENLTRSEGRNLGIEIAKSEIIALTDAGCVPNTNWLEKITEPFKNPEVDMVAGFYEMKVDTPFQKALSVFLGVRPESFNVDFLPSARSMAFRRGLWLKVGGFPEAQKDTAEDTVFNYKVLKSGAKIARVKNARVEWGMPETLGESFNKIYAYAKGDAKTKIWWHPKKRLTSHNIKAFFVLLRYVLGLILIIYGLSNPPLFLVLAILLIFYILWSFRKVFVLIGDWKAGLWGIVLQFTSDFAVIGGFLSGVWEKNIRQGK